MASYASMWRIFKEISSKINQQFDPQCVSCGGWLDQKVYWTFSNQKNINKGRSSASVLSWPCQISFWRLWWFWIWIAISSQATVTVITLTKVYEKRLKFLFCKPWTIQPLILWRRRPTVIWKFKQKDQNYRSSIWEFNRLSWFR